MKIDSVIFDLDGTLWDATTPVFQAWSAIAERSGYKINAADMQGVMGLQLGPIGHILFPELADDKAMTLMKEACRYENELITKNGGRLFDGTEEMLKTLSAKYPLFIVSNCEDGYLKAFFDYHKLDMYFTDCIYSGDKKATKGENIAGLVKKHSLKSPIYVGDTQGDYDAASFASVPFVLAAYGFGRVSARVPEIASPLELVELIKRI
jgi:phosphoglycolate phosphatase